MAVRKLIFGLYFYLVSLSGMLAQQYVESNSYLFSFPEKRDLFLADYGDNAFSLQNMNIDLPVVRPSLLSGDYHILIVSHVGAYEFDEASVINLASLRASRIRAYIKIKLSIPHGCITFYIDRSGSYRDQVHVYLVKSPVPWFANQEINYSDTHYPIHIESILKQYGAVPYVDLYSRKAPDGRERLVYTITDSLFKKEELEDYRLVIGGKPLTDNEHYHSAIPDTPTTTRETFDPVALPVENRAPHSPAGSCSSFLGIKTNLLPWFTVVPSLLLGSGSNGIESGSCMPNLALEYFFAGCWSVELSALYAAFPYKGKSGSRWALSSFSLEPRIWPVVYGYRGLNIGISGQYGDFDIFDGEKGRTGRFCSGSLTLGYLLPFGRGFCMEMSVGAGYRSVSDGTTYKTDSEGGNYAVSRFERSGFLLTAKLSMMYRFGFE